MSCKAEFVSPTHPNVVEDSLKLERLVLPLHDGGVQTITAVDELNDVASGAAYRQVVLWAQILQRLDQTPLPGAGQTVTSTENELIRSCWRCRCSMKAFFWRVDFYLHVTSFCSFDSRVHETFPTSHSVEEELRGCQPGVEAVGHEAFGSRQLSKHWKESEKTFQTWMNDFSFLFIILQLRNCSVPATAYKEEKK